MRRAALLLLGGVVLAIAAYELLWLRSLGLPDSQLTELDRSRIPLHSVFIGFSVLCGLCLVALAAVRWGVRQQVWFITLTVLYIAVTLAILFVDWLLGLNLGGAGG